MNVIFHIRRPLKKQKGNQFYKDRSNRSNGTYCGAEETAHDVGWMGQAERWINDKGVVFEPCEACIMIRKSEA